MDWYENLQDTQGDTLGLIPKHQGVKGQLAAVDHGMKIPKANRWNLQRPTMPQEPMRPQTRTPTRTRMEIQMHSDDVAGG
ncbi:unnamed protein product [Cladocopium goreaui]|uniref:Myomesin 3 n=1 Tax=Cladocopium goreaui TaxID=2562237 RepID=A0A9P1DDU7_9DINO|nr:unnamed protein product [Cladocopium goreaui]